MLNTLSLSFFLTIPLLFSCTKPKKSVSFEGPDALQSKDKVSEEPIGLPGYPLLCQWQSFPTQTSPSAAALDCFLGNSQREPVNIEPTPIWKVAYQGTASVTTSLIPPIFRISITAASSSEILEALKTLQVLVSANGTEKSLTGMEALKADAGQWRLGAACGNQFSISVIDSQAGSIHTSVNRFDGCEVLANRLVNVVLPNAEFRKLPDTHQAVIASCDGNAFTLASSTGQNYLTLGIFSAEACQDLRSLVNSLGI